MQTFHQKIFKRSTDFCECNSIKFSKNTKQITMQLNSNVGVSVCTH